VQTKRPFAYRDIPVKVVVEDVNTFYYNIGFNVESNRVEPIGGQGSMESLAENFTLGASAFNDLINEVKSNDIYKSLFVDGEFQGLEGLTNSFGMVNAADASRAAMLEEMFEKKMEQLSESQIAIKKASKLMKGTFETLVLTEFVDHELLKLQLTKDISSESIKSKSSVLIHKLFEDGASLESVISNSDEIANDLIANYTNYKNSYTSYAVLHSGMIDFMDQMKEEMDEEFYEFTVAGLRQELQYDSAEIEMNMAVLNLLMDEYSSQSIRQDYMNTYEKYDQIMNADFEMEYSVNGDEDYTTLTMQFLENSTIDSSGIGRIEKTRKINIPTNGGLRINSSAGMSILRFFNGHKSYSSTGGYVSAQDGDAFKPSLNTMFHFYKQTPSPVALGGSFGFGVPMEGEKDFIYMLGTSLIFGKSQRVIFNVGAFGGKNEILDGMELGDAIPEGSIVPTVRVFDFGMYVGLTLNISQFM